MNLFIKLMQSWFSMLICLLSVFTQTFENKEFFIFELIQKNFVAWRKRMIS